MEFCMIEKVNNSIATKLSTNSLNNRKNHNIFSARHNSTNKVYRALLKYENITEVG